MKWTQRGPQSENTDEPQIERRSTSSGTARKRLLPNNRLLPFRVDLIESKHPELKRPMPTKSLIFDPRDPDVIQRPLETLLRLQAEDPVHWSPLLKGWVLTRHDDVKAVQMNSGISSDRLTPFFESQLSSEQARLRDLIRYLNTWVAFKDPPDHTRLRSLLNKVVTPSVMRGLEEGIVELADGLLDRIAARGDGRFECVSEFANPLPAVCRQNIWHNSRRKLAECGPRLGLGFRRLACGVASADARWSVA